LLGTKACSPKQQRWQPPRQAWFGIWILNSGAEHKKKEIKQLNFDKTIADVVSNVCHCASSSVKTWIAVKMKKQRELLAISCNARESGPQPIWCEIHYFGTRKYQGIS
jgi:hypothetical protein